MKKRKPSKKTAAPAIWDLNKAGFLLQSLMDKEKEILHTEEALLESMKRFRDLFEQSPIGVGIHDLKGELLIVNKAWLASFGLDSFGPIAHYDLFKDLKLDEEQAKFLRLGRVAQYEAHYDFNDLGFKSSREGKGYLLFIVSPIHRDKDVIGYMTQVQDVTERKKIAEAQRLAQLGRLLSDMAHEVNNPLMIISGRAELALLDGIKDEGLKTALHTIVEQCFFAKDIIQRLLKYSRVGKVEKKAVDVRAAIELVADILGHHLRLSGVTVKTRPFRDLPPVNANDKQLQEVFMNLLHNAADAMPNGGTITISARRDEEFVRIEFEDTGEGMSQAVLERIFEPFFTTKQKGTGLGLAVCYTIIEEHGGKLFYQSKIGVGTKASILLPVCHEEGAGNVG
jgi:PAS domain S-box-containing protein